jgi:hypothetical protein
MPTIKTIYSIHNLGAKQGHNTRVLQRFFSLNDFNFIGSFLYFLDCTHRNNKLLKRKGDFEEDIDAFFRENQHLLNNIGVLFFHLSR